MINNKEKLLKTWRSEAWLMQEEMLLPQDQPLTAAIGLAQVVDRLMHDDTARWGVFLAQATWPRWFAVQALSVGDTATQEVWVIDRFATFPVGTVLDRGDYKVTVTSKLGIRAKIGGRADWRESPSINAVERLVILENLLEYFAKDIFEGE